MTHEFQHIIQSALRHKKSGRKSVLATVVALDGSSYRKPGVRMLISENDEMTGAVSGGCVEKEVLRRAQTVFETGQSKVMAYDGRFRLGCKGMLYTLIEPFEIASGFQLAFREIIEKRETFQIVSQFEKGDEVIGDFGSYLLTESGEKLYFRASETQNFSGADEFTQNLKPISRLHIIGAEHDAVKLSQQATFLGWETLIYCSPKNVVEQHAFPTAKEIIPTEPGQLDVSTISAEDAVVLMTHNYARDLHFLLRFTEQKPFYIGILGSSSRREELMNELIEQRPEVSTTFLDLIHSPAGINIGAITPEEIALSIMAEIVAVQRNKEVNSLKNISGKIHRN